MTGGPASVTAGSAFKAGLETAMMSSGEPGKLEKRMVVEIAAAGFWIEQLPLGQPLRCQLFFLATAALRTVANAVHAISGTASAAAV